MKWLLLMMLGVVWGCAEEASDTLAELEKTTPEAQASQVAAIEAAEISDDANMFMIRCKGWERINNPDIGELVGPYKKSNNVLNSPLSSPKNIQVFAWKRDIKSYMNSSRPQWQYLLITGRAIRCLRLVNKIRCESEENSYKVKIVRGRGVDVWNPIDIDEEKKGSERFHGVIYIHTKKDRLGEAISFNEKEESDSGCKEDVHIETTVF